MQASIEIRKGHAYLGGDVKGTRDLNFLEGSFHLDFMYRGATWAGELVRIRKKGLKWC